MALRELVVSPPGTGKTSYCIEIFKENTLKSKAGIDSRSFFVLPSREHAARIQSLVLRNDVPGLFNAHIITIRDLADRFLGGSGGGRPTDSDRRSVVAKALEAEEGGESLYRYFRESAALRGFQDLAVEVLREFKAGLLTPEEFDRRAQPLLKNPVFRSKFRDFSILLKRYDEALAQLGLAEPEDEILRQGIGGHDPPELVLFDGFYHFTRFQRKLIEHLSAVAAHTVVTLTMDAAHPAGESLFGYPLRTRAALLAMGFKEKKTLAKNLRTSDPALVHLSANLFSPSPAPHPSASGAAPVSILTAPSRRIEFEMIAREIRRLYREGGCHFSDICVILRSVSGRRALLDSVFAEYGVPAAVHERSRLAESGLAMALHRFLRLLSEDWKREDVLYLAKSSYFRKALPIEEALQIERCSLSENIQSGVGAWLELAKSDKLPAAARSFLTQLLRSEEAIRSAGSANSFTSAVRTFYEALSADPGLLTEVDSAAVRAVATLMAGARRRWASREGSFSAETSLRDTIAALEEGLFSMKRPGRNRVQVYDVVMALPKEYKVVFISDLLEKSFPQPLTEDPLFKDEERRVLNGKDGQAALDERGWRLSGERYFFYMAITRARERIYLTHSTHDEGGKPSLASFFIDEVTRCYASGAVQRIAKDPSDFLPGPEEWETESDVARGLAACLRLNEELRPGYFKPLSASWKGSAAFLRALRSRALDGPARLKDPRALQVMSSFAGPFSASGFESFDKCAFRYFSESLLKLRRPPEGLEDAEMGNLLHGVLYDYFSSISPERLASGDYWKEGGVMENELEELFLKRFAGAFRDQPLYRRAMFRESMIGMLKNYASLERRLAIELGLTPYRFEIGFGSGSTDHVRLQDQSGEILLKGSIDRIDIESDGRHAVVIDYKKSSRDLKKKIAKGEEIQLPLYALAAQRLLGLEPSGIEHRVLKTGRRENPDLSGDELAGLLVRTESLVRGAVRRIRLGEISVEPRECDFCPFDAVCRVETRKDRRVY